MKIRILLLLILFCATTLLALPDNLHHAFATCKGKTPCRACKNCNYCKHCNAGGGVCGVCKRHP